MPLATTADRPFRVRSPLVDHAGRMLVWRSVRIDVVPCHGHPLIEFRDAPSGRRASTLGSGLDVWEVIATVRYNGGSVDEAAAYLRIPVGLVQAAVAYFDEHRNELDAEIDLNEE